ncbi:hypothetical protein [Lactococcus allomyrinae]|uniref:hypothetical protein n=1 Tax=Lactococcus allomyrinae TaxID=2419773 RepID=UPI0013C49C37|nr:hypothetical protein [Lactococcus allomyrinae]
MIAIGSLIIMLLKKVLIKSAEKAVKIAQQHAQKAGKAFLGNNKALRHLQRIKGILHVITIIGGLLDFGVVIAGFVLIIVLVFGLASTSSACSNGSDDASTNVAETSNSNSKETFTLAQVTQFGNDGLTSTWGVSEQNVENYFLANNRATAAKYNLIASNIGEVSDAVKSEGVSPTFFWLYVVNEGGGAGGFINHYGSDSGNAVTDAKRDADYLVQYASLNTKVATVGGEPADMPTDEATSFLKAQPNGSIGRVYVQATSAVTAEIETLSGKTGDWTGKFNLPLSTMMNNIDNLGGNWKEGAKAQAAGDSNSSTTDKSSDSTDDDCSASDSTYTPGSIPSGGMKLTIAQNWMSKNYATAPLPSDYYGEAQGSPDVHDNCTLFSGWFVANFTDLKWSHGNGADIVKNLSAANGIQPMNKPEVYAIFSIQGDVTQVWAGKHQTQKDTRELFLALMVIMRLLDKRVMEVTLSMLPQYL